jgi:MYXO-CTERM domain-containing protein
VEAELPLEGDGALRLTTGTFAVTVREVGARGRGRAQAGAVAYARAGGTSFWTASARGVEEWLLLDAAAATGARAAAWTVTGATLRRAGEAVELADAAGIARVRVTAPRAYAEGGRAVQARLGVEGDTLTLAVDGGGAAVLVDPIWAPAGMMMVDRQYLGAARLPSGRVLAMGGLSTAAALEASAEIYDPATDAWLAAASMSTGRLGTSAVALLDGTVLLSSEENDAASTTAERYDEPTNTWKPTEPMHHHHGRGSSALLADGRVLVAGGWTTTGNPSPGAEVYDPATNAWTAVAPLGTPRDMPTVTRLPDGRVLVAGGNDGMTTVDTAEIYDPAADAWSPAAPMGAARWEALATLLPDGRVLVYGGTDDLVTHKTGEAYDPATDAWQPIAASASLHWRGAWAALPSGQMLLVGGAGDTNLTTSAELFDPGTNTWADAGHTVTAHVAHTVTVLADGAALVAGGSLQEPSAELYGDGTCQTQADCPPPGDCLVTFCAGAQGCIVNPSVGGAPCSFGFCQGGVCIDGIDVGAGAGPGSSGVGPGSSGAGASSGAGPGSSGAGGAGAAGGAGGAGDDGGSIGFGGCGCQAGAPPPGGSAAAALGLLAALARRRRSGRR